MHLSPIALLDDIGFYELLLVAFAAVVIFGRRLPQVAARGFAQFQRVRRSLTQMWRETGIEDEIRRLQRDLDRATREHDSARIARRETHESERAMHQDGRPHRTDQPAADGPPAQPVVAEVAREAPNSGTEHTDEAAETSIAPGSDESGVRRDDAVHVRSPES